MRAVKLFSPPFPPCRHWLLTVSAGEHTARAAIRWADEALGALEEIERSKARSRMQRRTS